MFSKRTAANPSVHGFSSGRAGSLRPWRCHHGILKRQQRIKLQLLVEKHGYREIATIQNYYGRGQNAFEMQKSLCRKPEGN